MPCRVQFRCPHCHETIAFEIMVSEEWHCPRCAGPVNIPETGETVRFFKDKAPRESSGRQTNPER
jgi:transcription initiation factor IIE alpha subunit